MNSNLLSIKDEFGKESDETYNIIAKKYIAEKGQNEVVEDIGKLQKEDDQESEDLEKSLKEIENLKKEIALFEEQNKQITNDLVCLTEAVEERVKTLESLNEERRSKEAMSMKFRSKHNLYTLITKIHWSKTCGLNDVQGFVNEDKLKPFCLSLNENSNSFISHFLWNLISDK